MHTCIHLHFNKSHAWVKRVKSEAILIFFWWVGRVGWLSGYFYQTSLLRHMQVMECKCWHIPMLTYSLQCVYGFFRFIFSSIGNLFSLFRFSLLPIQPCHIWEVWSANHTSTKISVCKKTISDQSTALLDIQYLTSEQFPLGIQYISCACFMCTELPLSWSLHLLMAASNEVKETLSYTKSILIHSQIPSAKEYN